LTIIRVRSNAWSSVWNSIGCSKWRPQVHDHVLLVGRFEALVQ